MVTGTGQGLTDLETFSVPAAYTGVAVGLCRQNCIALQCSTMSPLARKATPSMRQQTLLRIGISTWFCHVLADLGHKLCWQQTASAQLVIIALHASAQLLTVLSSSMQHVLHKSHATAAQISTFVSTNPALQGTCLH